MLKIGNHNFSGRAFLAPMAGITDLPFRQICMSHGAALATSEMLTSDVNLWESDKSRFRLQLDTSAQAPKSIQIAGSDPEQLAEAAQQVVKLGADIVDINMGCPAKKVCKKLAGSALLQNEKLVQSILSTVVAAVNVPVTLKTRTGWDTANKNGVRIAKMAQDSGIAAIAIHGRTRACRFNGSAEYDSIAEIVKAVSIPVIANGDITSAQKAVEVLNYTGAQAIMIGRAALGNPWIFQEINEHISFNEKIIEQETNKETRFCAPTAEELMETLLDHLHQLHSFYGEVKGARIARKHFTWYCNNNDYLKHGDTKPIIKSFNVLDNPEEQHEYIYNYFSKINHHEDIAA